MRVKIHRIYTQEEASRLLGVCKATVSRWIDKDGLPTVDKRRPILIRGVELRHFLQNLRVRAKKPCPPAYMYCFKCRDSRYPAGGVADYKPASATQGRLEGICSVCDRMMFRVTSLSKLEAAKGNLVVSLPSSLSHIKDTCIPHVKVDLRRDG